MPETTRYLTRRKYRPFESIQNQQMPQPTSRADLVALVNVVACLQQPMFFQVSGLVTVSPTESMEKRGIKGKPGVQTGVQNVF